VFYHRGYRSKGIWFGKEGGNWGGGGGDGTLILEFDWVSSRGAKSRRYCAKVSPHPGGDAQTCFSDAEDVSPPVGWGSDSATVGRSLHISARIEISTLDFLARSEKKGKGWITQLHKKKNEKILP